MVHQETHCDVISRSLQRVQWDVPGLSGGGTDAASAATTKLHIHFHLELRPAERSCSHIHENEVCSPAEARVDDLLSTFSSSVLLI